MRRFVGYFGMLLLLLNYSCANRPLPERVSVLELNDLEVQYALEHPEALQKPELQRDLDFIVRNYIDTVNLSRYFRDQPDRHFLQEELRNFYRLIGYRLAWNTSFGKLKASNDLTGVLGEAYKRGLNPQDYEVEKIIDMQRKVYQHGNLPSSLKDLMELDVYMSSRFLIMGFHLNSGRLNPVEVLDSWYIGSEKANISEILYDGFSKQDLASAYDELEPDHEDYQLLKEYFLKYLNITKETDEINLSGEVVGLSIGDTSWLLPNVKKKLMLFGDLDQDDAPSNEFDKELEKAILQFQIRHGIDQTGQLDLMTFEELQVSVADRLEVININLERLKWFPELDDRFIIVNVPEFKMKLYEKREKKMEMKAIVGREVNPTPVMMEEMTYIVFNPTWTVPYSITSEQFLPKIKEDIDFLEKNNYLLYDGWGSNANLVDPKDVDWDEYTEENFPYVIVQEPGPNNALGQVQFMMPNNHAIYLHDTPANYLFDNDERAFSHGCVRLERPLELAEYLLNDRKNWNSVSLDSALSEDDPVKVSLPDIWPVYLLYLTAWVDDNGLLQFRDDVYGLDAEQIAALERLNLNFPIAQK